MRVQPFLVMLLVACAANADDSAAERAAAGRQELIAQFGAERTLRGRVVDEQGRPVMGAEFYAGVYTLSDSTPSDRDGRYVVGIGPGYPIGEDIHLSVRAQGFIRGRSIAPLGAREHVIVMRRGAGIRAELGAGTDDLEGRIINVRSRSGDVQEFVVRDGRFMIRGLTPDERQVHEVRVAGFVPLLLTDLELTDGSVRDLGRLELDPGAVLEVVARDIFDEPVPGAGVRIAWAADLPVSWYAVADARGVARIEGLPPRVELEVESSPPEGFGRSLRLEMDTRTVTLDDADGADGDHVEEVLLRRSVVLRGRLRWGGPGAAPWSADRRLRIEGVAVGPAGERWTYSGATPDRGAPLGENEVEFHLWAKPGRWDLKLLARREGERRGYVARILDVEIPEPARGERSGELDVGVVVFGPTAR